MPAVDAVHRGHGQNCDLASVVVVVVEGEGEGERRGSPQLVLRKQVSRQVEKVGGGGIEGLPLQRRPIRRLEPRGVSL